VIIGTPARDRSESLSAFNRNRCPQSSESAAVAIEALGDIAQRQEHVDREPGVVGFQDIEILPNGKGNFVGEFRCDKIGMTVIVSSA
jgi:hypothetical protein